MFEALGFYVVALITVGVLSNYSSRAEDAFAWLCIVGLLALWAWGTWSIWPSGLLDSRLSEISLWDVLRVLTAALLIACGVLSMALVWLAAKEKSPHVIGE